MTVNPRIIDDITRFIFVRDELGPCDIIFLPGGSHPEQGERAAELFRQGFAPYVMPCGGVSVKTGKFDGVKARRELYDGDYATDWAFLADVLRKNGVPESAILREDASGWTKENAFFARRVADGLSLAVRRAIVCCKSFHARRSLICYQLAFPEAELLVCPVPYCESGGVEISAENWHMTEIGVGRVLGELARCGNQFNEELTAALKGGGKSQGRARSEGAGSGTQTSD